MTAICGSLNRCFIAAARIFSTIPFIQSSKCASTTGNPVFFFFCCTWVNVQARKTILRTTHICSQEVTIPLRPCASRRTPLLDLAYYRTSTLQHCDVVDEPTGPAFTDMDDNDHLWPYLATFQATKSSSKTALRYNKKNEYQVREACSAWEDRDNILVRIQPTQEPPEKMRRHKPSYSGAD